MPRINATITPEADRALRQWAKASNRSISEVVAEICGLCAPALMQAAIAFERAQAAPVEVAKGLMAAVRDIEAAAAARGWDDMERAQRALVEASFPIGVLAKAAQAAGGTPAGAGAAVASEGEHGVPGHA